jgi:hypothetical protein
MGGVTRCHTSRQGPPAVQLAVNWQSGLVVSTEKVGSLVEASDRGLVAEG